jgi:hypothetical protein
MTKKGTVFEDDKMSTMMTMMRGLLNLKWTCNSKHLITHPCCHPGAYNIIALEMMLEL